MTRPTHMRPDGTLCFPEGEPDATALPAGYWQEHDFAAAKAAKQAEISAGFVAATLAGCESPWGWVDCDEVAQGRITRLAELMERTGATAQPVKFTRFDRSQVVISYGDLVQLGILIGQHFLALFDLKQEKEAALAAAGDIAAINAIDATDWTIP